LVDGLYYVLLNPPPRAPVASNTSIIVDIVRENYFDLIHSTFTG
jgi:hypothetical protein